ncbi:hypothetical protein SAMN04487770_15012 [Butyrivibrio sp. ob235]|uniref:hypothetical protein n=1 Tax=Butyrivibrio sp. ob235 TaxID=1761780 RepID=UPI0008ADD021|nr:hypothetical protein [Butyrivibrio sp. ob235]SEM59029.1 hypothetical protein SAMN04487770_15012 [Butyrivibrio sp. ob235]
MKRTINEMNAIIREYKEYQELEAQLKAQMEELKAEAIEIMGVEHIDEYTCNEGKCTYREVLSNRFQSTEFKKIHKDLYEAFTMQTSSMRFTCN